MQSESLRTRRRILFWRNAVARTIVCHRAAAGQPRVNRCACTTFAEAAPWNVRFQTYNLANLLMGWVVRPPRDLTILQSRKPPHGMSDCNLTIYKPSHGMQDSNLTILQTSSWVPWDVRFQSYNLTNLPMGCKIASLRERKETRAKH